MERLPGCRGEGVLGCRVESRLEEEPEREVSWEYVEQAGLEVNHRELWKGKYGKF